MPDIPTFDIAIIGGGPAGLTAGLYAGRGGLRAAVVEKLMPGGLVANTERIDNYPGFPEGISGYDLAQRMQAQAAKFGAQFVSDEAAAIAIEPKSFLVRLSSKAQLRAKALVIASGAYPRTLGVPGEKELLGKGVSYCAVCDGAFFKNQDVAVVGGGDSAVQEAVYLAGLCSTVTVVHRRSSLRAAESLQRVAFRNGKISFSWNRTVVAIEGGTQVEGLRVMDKETMKEEVLPVSGVFIYVGYHPNSAVVKDLVQLDENGYIVTDENLMTSAPGIFAAGDVRRKLVRQISGAVGDAATAAVAAQQYIENL
ncbi:MAG: thioredoxin-disulfide reductase [Candidatus Edwardsbacteria bacterium]|nr:thioredoxin-disulfide reductase [Candidatus Edwardsbacteria bacterium]